MKVQIQQQSVRLRVDEAEFAQLLAGDDVVNDSVLAEGVRWSQRIALGDLSVPTLKGDAHQLRVRLPRDAVVAYSQRLPCREGLAFTLGIGAAALQLQFDVDVRDSMRERGPRRRHAESVSPV